MSEGNEGIGTRAGDVLAIEYDHAGDDGRKCSATIESTARGANVIEGTLDCPMGNRGVRPWGPYLRVEPRK
jgi:hypothetical protein